MDHKGWRQKSCPWIYKHLGKVIFKKCCHIKLPRATKDSYCTKTLDFGWNCTQCTFRAFKYAKICLLKGKSIKLDAGKPWKRLTLPGFEPGISSTEVRCPYPYTTDSLGNLAKKIKVVNIQWQKVANIQGGKFKPRKIQNFKGL